MLSNSNLLSSDGFLTSGGAMGELIRRMNWSITPLGEPERWPESLKASVSTCLNSCFPMVIWWGKERVKIYNDAYLALVGLKYAAPMGVASLADISPQTDSLLQGVFETGKAATIHSQLEFATDSISISAPWCTHSYSAIWTKTGTVGGVFGTINQKAIKAINQEHVTRQFSNLFVQAPVAICILRGGAYIIEVINERMADMWAKKVADVINKPAFDVLPELMGQGFKILLDNVCQSGERFVTEEMPISLMRNGSLRQAYVKFIYEPLKEEDGSISGVMAMAHEITEQVEARKKLEQSETFVRTILESSPDCLKVIDKQGKIIFMNSNGMCALEIDDFNEVKDKAWWDMWSGENKEAVQAALAKVLTGEQARFQARELTIKGTSKWWDILVSPIFEAHSNHVQSIVASSRDITQRKEEERLKDNFIALASHELRTPFTSIKGFCQLAEIMLKEKGDTETLAILARMHKQVDKMGTLIEDLLDVKKIKAGILTYYEAWFDFNDFVKETVQDIQSTIKSHRISLEMGVADQVFGDKEKLGQVIRNLISNAIKYSPGAVEILVSTCRLEKGMQLSVQDFGIGIATGYRHKVFEEFSRITTPTQSTFPGLGIGLFISSEIIKKFNGRLWIEHTGEEGSVFSVFIPFDRQAPGKPSKLQQGDAMN